MKRTIDTETLERIVYLADGWINITVAALRPIAIIKMLQDEDPAKAIDFLRSTHNQYCDRLKAQLEKAQAISDEDPWTENAEYLAAVRSKTA